MKKTLMIIFGSIILLIFLAGLINRYILTTPIFQTKAGIKITSIPEASVFINGVDQGKTPFQNEAMSAGEYQIKLENQEKSWQGKVKLSEGTVTTINRDLAETQASSSGEVLVLEKGSGVIITSYPSKALVMIDGIDSGQTPIWVNQTKEGEHFFQISYPGFVPRNVKAIIPAGYELQIHVDLKLTEYKQDVLPTPNIVMPVRLKVLSTPLGYLRVREKPSVSAPEIAQLTVDNEVELIEEISNWSKIKLQNGTVGYVSNVLVQKIPQ